MTFAFRFTVAAFLSSSLLFALSCGERPAANAEVEVKTPDATVGVPGGEITYRVSGPPTTFNYLLAEDEPAEHADTPAEPTPRTAKPRAKARTEKPA